MLARLLHRLFGSRRSSLSNLHLRMYTRSGCHLCDEAWKLLEQEQKEYRFLMESVDVDTDPSLKAEFSEWVPVITVNGEVRFRGGVNRVLLKRLLDAERQKS